MRDCAIDVQGISKTYVGARIGAVDTSLRELLTTCATRPWRLLTRHRERRGDIRALRPVSFQVPAGQKLGILGRNGSGKSTLLKILSRITPPSAGRAVLHGRAAAILEVGTGFHPDLTGHENIYLGGAILGLRRAFIRERLPEIVAFAELEDYLDLPVKRYSSGMYVRLAFAVAAFLQSDILFVDEVLAVGDEGFREKCIAKMEADAADAGRTIVLVSHDTATMQRFCDRCLLLHEGELVFDGDPAQAVERYRAACERHPQPTD